MNNAYSLPLARLLFSCFLVSPLFFSHDSFAQTQCGLGSLTLNVVNLSPQINGELLICQGGASQLQVSPSFDSYFWSNGASGQSITVTAADTYTVTVSNATGCTATASFTVTLAATPAVAITGELAFCTGENTLLTATSGYSLYNWSGGGADSSLTVTTAGTYTVTVTAASGCTASASAVVTASSPAPLTVSGDLQFCQGDSTALTAQGVGYVSFAWSNGKNAQSINTALAGNYTVTATDANGCTSSASATVTAQPLPTVDIAPIAGVICDSEAPFNLSATPAGGTWSGDVGPGGAVDPSALGVGTWAAIYEYTDANGCSGNDQLAFEIAAGTAPSIAPAGPFCPTEGNQTLSAMPAGGTWGGSANAAGEFDPSALGPGVYTVTYSIAATGNCTNNTQATMVVNAAPAATISGSDVICDGSGQSVPMVVAAAGNGPFEVSYTINGGTPITASVPVGTTNINASTAGVYEIISITDAGGCVGSGSGQAVISTVAAPVAANLDLICDAAQSSYQAVFEITGGDAASYAVNSAISGSLSSGPPYIFTSDFVASGNSFQFEISDANGCAPTLLTGSFSCNCGTNAGSLDGTPLVLCVGETATAQPLSNGQLQPDDVLLYYLHSGSSNSLGTVFGTNTVPSFDFAPPLVAGQTYYISAVAGSGDGAGGIDLNDPCLSVSYGTPVTWQAAPTGNLTGGAVLCEGETANLVFTLNGIAPFYVTYSDGAQSFSLQGIPDGYSITVSPATTATYTLVSVEDSSAAGCSASPGTSVTFVVNEPDTTILHDTSCLPAEVGVFTNVYTNQNGCDSTVILTVTYQSFDEVFLDKTTCDPAMAGVFVETLTNQNGCDSIVTTTVTLLPSSTTALTATTCDPTQAGIFTEILTNQNGCDSVVTTTVTLLPSDLTELATTTCDPSQAGVFIDTLTNQYGCDSVVVTTVNLLSPNECNVAFQLAAAVIPCGSNEGSISIEVALGQFPLAYNYSGTGGSGSGSVTGSPFSLPPLPAGQYSVTLTNANGLSATETIEVVQASPPTVTIDLLNGLPCSGEPLAALSANVTGDFPPYSLLWSNGATTTTISSLGAGNYGLVVTGGYGCEATAAAAITELPSFEIGFTVSNPDCFENSHGSVTVDVTGGEPPYQFALNNGDFQTANSFDDLADGAYQIAVMDANGCKKTAAFAINAPLVPEVSLGDDLTVEAGDGVSIHAIVNLPDSLIASISWEGLGPNLECPDCLVQQTVPLVTSTYSIVVESVDGCTDSDEVTVFVKKGRHVYVPSAFSPDGDGINDVFYPFAKNNSVEKINTFYVFSRWGESVFSATDFQPNDPTHGWDGKHRGQALDAGVFVWFAEIKFKDGEVELFEGDVTLMR